MRAEMNKYKAIVTALTAEPSDRKEGTDDGYYFDSYSHLSIHETMLRDAPRTGAYARAISSPDFMRGKVVLDVGCGTGILCLLAARAGAKKVIGIDFSSMIEKSRQVVEQNGYSDVITLIRGRVEEVRLPVDEVDVIVSEWMGYGLYYENMLSSVLHARKEYLAEGGVVMPSHALLFLEAMTATGEHDRVNWWRDVYGFDMTPCSRLLTQEAQVQSVDPDLVVSDRALVHTLDMAVAEDESLDFVVPFSLTVKTPGPVRAIALSFDVEFRLAAAPGSGETTVLSTAVQSPETHWKQTVLWLQPEFVEEWASGDVISGTLEYHRREANARDYDISVTWTSSAASGAEERTQLFILGS
jgi:precorrin-6B methylase 2